MNKKFWIYMAGVAPFGLFYEPLNVLAGSDPAFLVGGIVYLLLCRLLAEKFGKVTGAEQ